MLHSMLIVEDLRINGRPEFLDDFGRTIKGHSRNPTLAGLCQDALRARILSNLSAGIRKLEDWADQAVF